MSLPDILRRVELFDGLSTREIDKIADLCEERTYLTGDVITRQGEAGDELYLIASGLVEVVHSDPATEPSPRAVVNLGQGQVFGEMALVDFGPRSATVRVISDNAMVQVIKREDFNDLCEREHHLGFIVMRNIAADLSFKLRHSHLSGR